MTEKVVWYIVREYALVAGIFPLAPHDLRRYAEFRTMPNALGGGISSRPAIVYDSA
jgi:hypothetical protein